MMTIGSLCSGYGGLCELALAPSVGGRVVWHAENDPGAARLLAHHWPETPNLGDITSIDWAEVEPVDWLTAGFPCQDVSLAGKRAGIRPGTRSGIWSHIAYGISVLRPARVLIENVGGLLSAQAHSDVEPCPWCLGDSGEVTALRALGAVLGDLAGLGYDARWTRIRASDVGAAHGRPRIFVLASDTDRQRGDRGRLHQPGERRRPESPDRGGAASDTPGVGRGEVRTESTGGGRGFEARLSTPPAAHRQSAKRRTQEPEPLGSPLGPTSESGERPGAAAWGKYEPAINRWAAILGRPAPVPREPGTKDNERMTARFVEWHMGLPSGHVTDVPGLSRNDQLHILGNGVVPLQAALALRLLTEHEVAA